MAINISKSRDRIMQFLSQNTIGVLATADKTGLPHAATVYFTHDDDLNIYFITKDQTQKSRDIKTNNQAAIAIYEPSSQTTVQAEGRVEEVEDPAQSEKIFYEVWTSALQTSESGVLPFSKLTAGGYVVYKISAPTLRLATFNINGDKHDIFETVPV